MSQYGFTVVIKAKTDNAKAQLGTVERVLRSMKTQLGGTGGVYNYLKKISMLDFSHLQRSISTIGNNLRFVNINAQGLDREFAAMRQQIAVLTNTMTQGFSTLSANLNATNQQVAGMATNLNGLNASVSAMGNNMASTGATASASLSGINTQMGLINGTIQNVNRSLEQAKGGFIAWTLALLAYGQSTKIIESTATFQKLTRQLRMTSASTEEATQKFKELMQLAVKTPALDIKGAISLSTSFERMGYSALKAKNATEVMANAVALLSGGGATELERMKIQLEQLAFKTSGYAQDLRALGESLPNIGQVVREAFNVESIEQLSHMGITGREVVDAILAKYSELPKANKTVKDSVEALHSAMMLWQSDIGTALLPLVDKITNALMNFADFIHNMPSGLKNFGATLLVFGAIINFLPAVVSGLQKIRQLFAGHIPVLNQFRDAMRQVNEQILNTSAWQVGTWNGRITALRNFVNGARNARREMTTMRTALRNLDREMRQNRLDQLRLNDAYNAYSRIIQQGVAPDLRTVLSALQRQGNVSVATARSISQLINQYERGSISLERLQQELNALHQATGRTQSAFGTIANTIQAMLLTLETTETQYDTAVERGNELLARRTQLMELLTARTREYQATYGSIFSALGSIAITGGFMVGNALMNLGRPTEASDVTGMREFSTGQQIANILGHIAMYTATTAMMTTMLPPQARLTALAAGATLGLLTGVSDNTKKLAEVAMKNRQAEITYEYERQIRSARRAGDSDREQMLTSQRDTLRQLVEVVGESTYRQFEETIRAQYGVTPENNFDRFLHYFLALTNYYDQEGRNDPAARIIRFWTPIMDRLFRILDPFNWLGTRELMERQAVYGDSANASDAVRRVIGMYGEDQLDWQQQREERERERQFQQYRVSTELEIADLRRRGLQYGLEELSYEADRRQILLDFNTFLQEGNHTLDEQNLEYQRMLYNLEQLEQRERERLNRLQLQQMALESQNQQLQAQLNHQPFEARAIENLNRLNQVLNNINSTPLERANAWLEFLINDNKLSVDVAKATQNMNYAYMQLMGNFGDLSVLKAWDNYMLKLQDAGTSMQEIWQAFWEFQKAQVDQSIKQFQTFVNKISNMLNKILQKRKQHTDAVINEIERERQARDKSLSIYSQGISAVLGRVTIDNASDFMQKIYTPEEIAKAEQKVAFNEWNKEQANNQVDYALNKDTTTEIERALKQLEQVNEFMQNNNITGMAQLTTLQDLSNNLTKIWKLLTTQQERGMAW